MTCKKRWTALLLVVCLLLGTAACAGKGAAGTTTAAAAETTTAAAETTAAAAETTAAAAETTAAGKSYQGTTLKVWLATLNSEDVDAKFWKEHFQTFTEKTGCAVELTLVDWGTMFTQYTTAFMANEGPDVLYVPGGGAYDLVQMGVLADVQDYFTDEEKDNLLYWDTGAVNGKWYTVPFDGGGSQRCMFFNMDLLKAAGVEDYPKTWDELVAAAKKVLAYDSSLYAYMTPLSGPHAPLSTYEQLLYQAGGSMMNADCSAYAFDSDASLKAVTFLHDMIYKDKILSKDCVSMTAENITDLFTEGKVAMCSSYIGWDTSGCDFNWVAATDLKGTTEAALNPIDYLSVSNTASNMDAAVDLVKFIISDAVCDDVRATLDVGMGKMTKTDQYQPDAHFQDIMEHPERSYSQPNGPSMSDVFANLNDLQQMVAMDELTPQEFCTQAQAMGDSEFTK